jgi:FAD:protein FMN transferase
MISAGNCLLAARQSHSREWLFCLLAIYLLAALAGCSGETQPNKLSGATMGTTWHVSYVAPTASSVDAVFLQAGIEDQLEQVNRSMSTYRADSEISVFNALEPKTWFTSSRDFFYVLTTALEIGELSEGAYDVTVGPLVDLWGFGPDGGVEAPPTDQQIAKGMKRVGQQYLEIDADSLGVTKERPLSLDFSSLAKGYAVDQVAQWLQAQGVVRFMVEVGGEMRVSGLSSRDDPWRIAIEQPDVGGRSVATILSLTDVAVATSGDYRNYFVYNGLRFSHSIDPRTGYPVAHDLVSVTVVHSDCMIADAWATALTVLGAERAMAVAQAQGLAVYFIRSIDGDFTPSYTAQFSRYLGDSQSQGVPDTKG